MSRYSEDYEQRARRTVKKALKWSFIAATALTGSIFGLRSFYINQDRQVSLEVLFGKVTEEVNTPGFKWKNPFASRHAYSLALHTNPVHLDSLRLGDDIRLSAKFDIDYQIDRDSADYGKLYFDLRGQGNDIESVVSTRANDAAVKALESLTLEDVMPSDRFNTQTEDGTAAVSQQERNSFTEKMTSGIHQQLQHSLNRDGWPIRIIAVHTQGFGFTQASEERIAEVVGIRMENFKLDLREQNAAKAQVVFEKEADAYAAYLNSLRQAGLTDNAVANALCLKLAQDAGRINEPFAAGCFEGGQRTGVNVPAPQRARTATATPSPSP